MGLQVNEQSSKKVIDRGLFVGQGDRDAKFWTVVLVWFQFFFNFTGCAGVVAAYGGNRSVIGMSMVFQTGAA